MRIFALLVLSLCSHLSLGTPRAYADASPDPMPTCRAEDIGKPCPKTPFGPPRRCVELRCDDDKSQEVGGRPMCYFCQYDADADRPNIERRERARALEIAAAEREEQQLTELKQRKKRNLILLGVGLSLLAAAYFAVYRFRAKKA